MFDEPEDERSWLENPPTVAAILVAHNGMTWLPQVLQSLTTMDFAPSSWNAVDVSSTDGSGELLRESFGEERIQFAPSGTGFGAAVDKAVDASPPTDWIWLLHDDCAITPGTLTGLMDEALASPDIAIVGPKIREWPSLRRLLEVGISITSTGNRETGLEPGEPDAGQHDWPRDVLAVSTAGMLVRRDVWDELGGLDPALPLYFDDVDFGWRAAKAGYRSRTAPGAILFHAEASSRSTRRATAGDPPTWEFRRAAMFTLLANVSRRRFLWQYVKLFFGTLVRAFGLLMVKAPEEAGDQLFALRAIYLKPSRIRAARSVRSRQRKENARDIKKLLPSPWLPYQHGLDTFRETATAIVRPETIETSGRRSVLIGAAADEIEQLPHRPSIMARRPWFVTVLVLVVLSFIAARGLFSGAELHGGGLLPVPGSAGDWWKLFFERGHDVGTGSVTMAPPYVLLLAVASSVTWFRPGIVVAGLLLFVLVWAGLSAHRLGRRLSDSRSIRIIWALTYAFAIVGTGAVSQGRIGTVIALIVAPIIANTALQLIETPGWQLGLRLGIWISVATAFAPVMYPISLVGLVFMYFGARGRLNPSLVISAVLPFLLLGPWMIERVTRPMKWFWEAGVSSGQNVSAVDVALGRAGGAVQAPAWLTGGVILLALLALVPRRTRPEVGWAWAIALTGLAVAVLGNATTFTTFSSPREIHAWIGLPLVVWIGGLATAALIAASGAPSMPRSSVIALVVVALVLPVGTGAWWLVRGEAEPLTRASREVVPAFLAERPGSTLVVSGGINRGIDYQVVRSTGIQLGDEAVLPPVERTARLTSLVTTLLSNPTDDDIRSLAGNGIDAIYAPDVDSSIASRLDAAPRLAPAGSDDPDSRVWTLDEEARATDMNGHWWRPLLAGVEVLLWIGALILIVPVRRRSSGRARR